jgi:hypothetical protein
MKQCPQCEKENPSSANCCMYCGAILVEENLDETARLQMELNEGNETIRLLKLLLVEKEESEKTAETELGAEKQKNIESEKIITEKNIEITQLSEQLKKTTTGKSNKQFGWWLVIIFIIIAIIFGNLVVKTQENDKLTRENNKLKSKISNLANDYPIIIQSLKVGNITKNGTTETPFGEKLFSSTSMYLSPQIEYIGLKTDTITLYMKLYRNEVLQRNSESSPKGYTYSVNIPISDENTTIIGGWGSDSKGTWSVGKYRYEIWQNNVCLKIIEFKLY